MFKKAPFLNIHHHHHHQISGRQDQHDQRKEKTGSAASNPGLAGLERAQAALHEGFGPRLFSPPLPVPTVLDERFCELRTGRVSTREIVHRVWAFVFLKGKYRGRDRNLRPRWDGRAGKRNPHAVTHDLLLMLPKKRC
eukprot:gene13037-biopygen3540